MGMLSEYISSCPLWKAPAAAPRPGRSGQTAESAGPNVDGLRLDNSASRRRAQGPQTPAKVLFDPNDSVLRR